MKSLFLLSSLTLLENIIAYKANLDYCNEHEKRSFDFFGHHELSSTYCCKHCCETSVTSAKKCTKDYCMSLCPGEGDDSHGCYIKDNGQSHGCAES